MGKPLLSILFRTEWAEVKYKLTKDRLSWGCMTVKTPVLLRPPLMLLQFSKSIKRINLSSLTPLLTISLEKQMLSMLGVPKTSVQYTFTIIVEAFREQLRE